MCVRIQKHTLCWEGLMSGLTLHFVYCSLIEFEVAGTSNPLQINQVFQIYFKSIRRELLTIMVY